MTTRRQFLHSLLAAAGLSLLPLSRSSWVLANTLPSEKHFIVILLRGAVDGLSLVAPYAEANYYALRPKISLCRRRGRRMACWIWTVFSACIQPWPR